MPNPNVSTCEYEALGRRIAKHVSRPFAPDEYFYYDGNRIVEHYKGTDPEPPLHRQYVWGFDYIDELIGYYANGGSAPQFVLQDANYNVIAAGKNDSGIIQQYSYEPYGGMFAAEDVANGITIPLDPASQFSELGVPFGFHGHMHDWETGKIHMRVRAYDPTTGRPHQRDPYQTALVIVSALRSNAQTAMVFANFRAGGQFADGMNLYGFARSNPIMLRDPDGQLVWHFVAGGLIGGLFGGAHKAIELFVSGRAAYQDWGETYSEIGKAAIQGGIAGVAFMGLAATGGIPAAATFGGTAEAWTTGVAGGMGVGLGLWGAYQAAERSQYALDTMDEFEMTMALVDHGFSGIMTLGGAIGVRTGLNAGIIAGRGLVTAEFAELQPGRSPGVRVVNSETELNALFERWGSGGKDVTPPTYDGEMVHLFDGTRVGLRNASSSGGKAIDVHFPDGVRYKVHIE